MPQRSEFKVYPQRLGSAGENLASCKSKAESLAQQLADLQPSLKSSASSVGPVVAAVTALCETINTQAKNMEKAANCVKFSADRYKNAEQQILGQAAASAAAAGAAGGLAAGKTVSGIGTGVGGGKADTVQTGKGGTAAGSGAPGVGGGGKPNQLKKEGGGTSSGGGAPGVGDGRKPDQVKKEGGGTSSGGGAPGVGGGGKPDQIKKDGGKTPNVGKAAAVGAGAAAGAALGRMVSNHVVHKSGWKESWKFRTKTDSYGKAYVVKKGDKEVVQEGWYNDYKKESVSLLNSTKIKGYKLDEGGNKLDGWAKKLNDLQKKANKPFKKLNYNYFKKEDPKDSKKDHPGDWSDRVWERRNAKDPADPKKEKMTRLLKAKDKDKNAFAKDIVGAKLVEWKKEAGYEAYNAKLKHKGKFTKAKLSLSILKAEAAVSAGAGVYYVVKNGKRMKAIGADATAGASVTLMGLTAKGDVGYAPDALKKTLGKDFRLIGVEGKAEGKVGHVEAEAGATCRIVDGKVDVAVSGDAGAYACKGSLTGRGQLLGVKVGGSLEGNVGVGVSGKVGFSGGKLRCEFGASLGVGFKVKFDIDVGAAVDAVKNGVTAAAKAVGNAVKSVGSAIATGAKAVGQWFSKW